MYLRKIDLVAKPIFLVCKKQNGAFFCEFSIAGYIAFDCALTGWCLYYS
jgi:hypothetical protein